MFLSRSKLGRGPLYVLNLLVSFHYFLVVFITSTFVSTYVDTQQLSLLYIAGSVLGVALFAYFTPLLKRFGNYYVGLACMLLEVLALVGLAFGGTPLLVITSFVFYLAVSPVIYLTLDLFLEKSIRDEGITGGVRGMFLTMTNIAQVIGPLLVGLLLFQDEYWRVFSASAAFLLAGIVLMAAYLRKFNDSAYHPRTLWQSAAYVVRHRSLYHAVAAQFLLRFFYAWMVIYTPLYLFQVIGFSWTQIGLIFSIMLLPFLLLELPLGRFADSRIGEKEILITGFVLLAGTVSTIPFLTSASFALWAGLLFMSRVGASCVEIATESYFFKHVDGTLADTISLFRAAKPITYIAAALVASLAFEVFSLRVSFFVLAVIMLWGLRYAFALKDTK